MTKVMTTAQAHKNSKRTLEPSTGSLCLTISTLVLVIAVVFSTKAVAWDSFDPYDHANNLDKVGIYVTPKLGWSYTSVNNIKESYSSSAHSLSYSGSIDDSYGKSVFAGGIALGYDLSPQTNVPIRTEVEYMYRSDWKEEGDTYDLGVATQSIDTKIQAQTVFINTYVDIPTGTPFTPYVGAGAGVAMVKTEFSDSATIPGFYRLSGTTKETETNFAWNIGAGGAFSFNENVALDINYRYVDMGTGKASASTQDPFLGKVKSKREADLTSHEVLMGLRFSM